MYSPIAIGGMLQVFPSIAVWRLGVKRNRRRLEKNLWPNKPALFVSTNERPWSVAFCGKTYKSNLCSAAKSRGRDFPLGESTREAGEAQLADSSHSLPESKASCSEFANAGTSSWPPNLYINFKRNCSRVLLIGLMFVMLDYAKGRGFSRQAFAAPPTLSTDSRTVTKRQEKVGKEDVRDGRESTRTDADETVAEWGEFFKHLLEKISVADSKGVRACLELLVQKEKLVGERVDQSYFDYLSAEAKLDGLSSDVAIIEKEAQKALVKEKKEVLASYRTIYSDIDVAAKRISQRLKDVATDRKEGVQQETSSSSLSIVQQDLEHFNTLKKNQNLLALAGKVEESGKSADPDRSAEFLQRVERKQKLSKKLGELLEMLLIKECEIDGASPELQQSIREERDLLLSQSRWQDGDEETRTPVSEDGEVPREEILAARDIVLNKSWYDERRKRWEMNPSAALYAVEANLAGCARIRQDWGIMYFSLKGDDREYVVNLREFDAEYELYGGARMLHLKMISLGVPSKVERMRIPLDERGAEYLVKLPFRTIWGLLNDFWNSSFVVAVWPWYYAVLVGAFEEWMIRFGFPVIHWIVPQKIRVFAGFELAEGAEAAEPTEIVTWQQEAQKHVDARYAEGSGSPVWWISLPVRCYVVGVPLLILLRFVAHVVCIPFGAQQLEMNDVKWKEKKQEELEKKLQLQTKKKTLDPIKSVFDNMKRVKRPQVSLKDFAGIDMIKEEINEIISFLQNPKLFREMGARAPRGVLIVGDSGTGKTTLALAIAAEARVPMVELRGSELEGGAWVGQGASNVRELFKTARELAPLIIFMDDFDHFAGVRGATSDTRKQDHESLINQLLVELDGFETQEGVVLVATTSRPFAIDEALRRPGRMDRTIQLPMPNKRERQQILRQAAQKTMDAHLVDYVDWEKVAEKTAGLTPAHLRYVPEGLEASAVSYKIADEEELMFTFNILGTINTRFPKWLMDSKWTKWYNDLLLDWLGLRVTKEDMETAVEYIDVFGESKPGIELYDPPYVWTRDFKFPHAVWAAGKGLIALLLPDFDSVDLIWLDPTSWEGIAFTKFSKRTEGGYEETGTLTRTYCEKELVSCFGALVASRMLLRLGENASLCKLELDRAEQVSLLNVSIPLVDFKPLEQGPERIATVCFVWDTKIATRMVMEYGWAADNSPIIYRAGPTGVALAMGDEYERDVATQINQGSSVADHHGNANRVFTSFGTGQLLFRASEKATQMLQQNQLVLEAMLEHLLEYDILNSKDISQILADNGAKFGASPFSLVPFTQNEIVGVSTNGTGRSGMETSVTVT